MFIRIKKKKKKEVFRTEMKKLHRINMHLHKSILFREKSFDKQCENEIILSNISLYETSH